MALSARAHSGAVAKEEHMHKIQKMVDIKAPAQRVYDFLVQPQNLPGIWPSMVEVSNVVAGTGGASDFDWVYKMGGMQHRGHSKIEEAQPAKLLRSRSDGAIQSTFRWTFRGLDGASTKLTCEIEYTIPMPVLGKLVESVVAKLNEREIETMLANLKDMMEHSTVGASVTATAHAR
jgi:uncharacterized membrane protein